MMTMQPGSVVGRVISVNVGMPADVPWGERTVHTGILKQPRSGQVRVGRLNLDGDGQGDLDGHGGPHRAVLVYQQASYEHWAAFLKRDDLTPGTFGENFTVEGLSDEDVFVGDRFRIGSALFEVTQPRVTCYRVGMRLRRPDMPALLVSHGRPGFYLRVLAVGEVAAGDDIWLERRGQAGLTVRGADALLYLPDKSVEQLRTAVAEPALSDGWRGSFQGLLDDLDIAATQDTSTRWSGFRPLRVIDAIQETPQVTSFLLGADDGVPLPIPRPGQHLTIRIPASGKEPLIRSYSISSGSDDAAYRISVKRDGAASRQLHDTVRPGAVLESTAPNGTFTLDESERPIAFFAGGIGATPLISMLHKLAAQNSRRTIFWLQSVGTRAELMFDAEILALNARLPGMRRYVRLSRDQTAAPEDSGHFTAANVPPLPPDTIAFLCGPPSYVEAMTEILRGRGVPAVDIRSEVFGATAGLTPGIMTKRTIPPHAVSDPARAESAVSFARSGITTGLGRPDATLLELAEACDVPVRWSCRVGVCHTCATDLVDGSVTYDPRPLEMPPPGSVLLCCARPSGNLVLDL